MEPYEQIKRDRDALAFLGLLTHAYLSWDPPIPVLPLSQGNKEYTHFQGLNIHSAVIDNCDGELLALKRNEIHQNENPLMHAEQLAILNAKNRVQIKRPRSSNTTVEEWYRNELFYTKGNKPEDFVNVGATLYTTLEPCPFCASALCVSRMKRVVYLLPDLKYGGAWQTIKARYYDSYDFQYQQLSVNGDSDICKITQPIYNELMKEVESLRGEKIQDIWLLDFLHNSLGKIFSVMGTITPDSFYPGDSKKINSRTLIDIKRACNIQC